MNTNTIKQIAVIYSDEPADFQKKFNLQMAALASKHPTIEFNHSQGFCAYITYEETTRQVTSIADEFHADGIRFECRNCPLHEIETDGRKKRVPCKYADTAFTKLDDEACEIFYRRLMQREIEPIGEPKEYVDPKKRNSKWKNNYRLTREGREYIG